MPVPRAFLYLRVPSKGVAPCGSPHRAPTKRGAPFPDPSFICHSTVSNKRNTLQVPQRSPYGESCAFSELSFMCLSDSPTKVLLIEKSHPSLEVPGKGSCSPKRDPYGKKTLVSRALLNISFRVPSKGALPRSSPHRAPIEIDTPFPESSFICLSKCKRAPL